MRRTSRFRCPSNWHAVFRTKRGRRPRCTAFGEIFSWFNYASKSAVVRHFNQATKGNVGATRNSELIDAARLLLLTNKKHGVAIWEVMLSAVFIDGGHGRPNSLSSVAFEGDNAKIIPSTLIWRTTRTHFLVEGYLGRDRTK